MAVFFNHTSELATVSTVFAVDGVATDPTTVSLTITDPDGTTTTYTYTADEIQRTGTGAYRKDISCASTNPGPWTYTWAGTGPATDADSGSWTTYNVGKRYATLEKLRGRVDRSDTVRDDELLDALDDASRQIDDDTGRRFWLDATTSAKVINPRGRVIRGDDGERLLVPDIGSTTGLIVEVGTVTAGVFSGTAVTDYETGPDDAPTDGHAIEWLLRPASCWRLGPLTRIRITARWGWPVVPVPIRGAALLLAHRRYRRRGSPEGVAGFGDMGVVRVSRFDPDYDNAIGRYVLPGFG